MRKIFKRVSTGIPTKLNLNLLHFLCFYTMEKLQKNRARKSYNLLHFSSVGEQSGGGAARKSFIISFDALRIPSFRNTIAFHGSVEDKQVQRQVGMYVGKARSNTVTDSMTSTFAKEKLLGIRGRVTGKIFISLILSTEVTPPC